MDNKQIKQWCIDYDSHENRCPLIMGILNVTPDSFSDGARYLQTNQAIDHALKMIEQGADLIDVGGESSRPGAIPVSCDEELSRVIPVIDILRKESDIAISIDTSKSIVMAEAIAAGAVLINDITALADEASLNVAASSDALVCLMHMQGIPSMMQSHPHYEDVVVEVNDFFEKKINRCVSAGIQRERLILDPGFGFGKLPDHNLRIVHDLEKFQNHKRPLLLGVSRKSTLGFISGRPINDRLHAGLTIAVVAAMKGMAMVRTHDVDATRQAFLMLQAIHKS